METFYLIRYILISLLILSNSLFYTWIYKSCAILKEDSTICELYQNSPITLLNIITFIEHDVIFFLVDEITGSSWLLESSWSLIPLAYLGFIKYHPSTKTHIYRNFYLFGFLLMWAGRWIFSYLRRQEWKIGSKVDWKIEELIPNRIRILAKWMVFYLGQHIMLSFLTQPSFYVLFHSSKFAWYEFTGIFLGQISCLILFYSEDQLLDFKHKITNKLEGWWTHLRHPNYLAEILWWWSIALLGITAPQKPNELKIIDSFFLQTLFMIFGPLAYTLIMIYLEGIKTDLLIEKKITEPVPFLKFLNMNEKNEDYFSDLEDEEFKENKKNEKKKKNKAKQD